MASTTEQQLRLWTIDVAKALDGFNKGDRKQILRKAAKPVRATAKAKVKDRRKSKASSGRIKGYRARVNRRYRGGKVVASYHPSNLKRSIRVIPGLNRSLDVFVGPFLREKGGPVFGRTISTAVGYYAAMAYEDGADFFNSVLFAALRKNEAGFTKIVRTESRNKIKRQWTKRGRKAG